MIPLSALGVEVVHHWESREPWSPSALGGLSLSVESKGGKPSGKARREGRLAEGSQSGRETETYCCENKALFKSLTSDPCLYLVSSNS